MARTYAVAWRTDPGPIYIGELEFAANVLLGGADTSGRRVAVRLRRDEIVGVRHARSDERLRGRRTLVLVCHTGEEIAVASLDWPGAVFELLEGLQTDAPVPAASRRFRQ